MSDPNQLVELVYFKATPSNSRGLPNNATEVNPFVILSPEPAQDAPPLPSVNALSGGADVVSTAATRTVPAPSAIELQSLLLAVATAEGVSKMRTLRLRGSASDGAEGSEKGDGAEERGVRGAAMEMLERLTNQLIST